MDFHSSFYKDTKNESSSIYSGDTKVKRDLVENSTKKLTSMFGGNFIDPFDLKNSLDSLVNFVLNCLDTRIEMLKKFVNERLVVKEGDASPEKIIFRSFVKKLYQNTGQ